MIGLNVRSSGTVVVAACRAIRNGKLDLEIHANGMARKQLKVLVFEANHETKDGN